jgi:hypothetical protein
LAHESQTACSERQPNGNLFLSRGCASQLQIGDVGAGDQQHQADRSHYQRGG